LKFFCIIQFVFRIIDTFFHIFPPKISAGNLLFFLHPVRWLAMSFIIIITYFPTGRRQSYLERRQLVEAAGNWLILRRL